MAEMCGLRGCVGEAVPGAFVEVEANVYSCGWGNRTERRVVRVNVCEAHMDVVAPKLPVMQ